MRKSLSYTDLESKVTLIQFDYNGISNVLNSIIELYKVCDKKELVDDVLEKFSENVNPIVLVQTENTADFDKQFLQNTPPPNIDFKNVKEGN